nr:ABC transporter substrate-binding protein [Azoarcus indigens]
MGACPWPGTASLRLAESEALLPPACARLLDFPNASMVLAAFRNGSLDAAVVTLDEALLLAAHDQAPRLVCVVDFSEGASGLLTRPPAEGLGSLRGARVGVETEAGGAYLVAKALERAGIGLDEVVFVPLPLDRHEDAYLERRVDALVSAEPVRSRLLALGARELFSTREMAGELANVIVVRELQLASRRADVRCLIAGHFAGRERLLADPRAAAQALGPRAGLPPEAFSLALQGLRLPDPAENRRLFASGELAEVLGQVALTLHNYRLLHAQVPGESLLDSSLIEEV